MYDFDWAEGVYDKFYTDHVLAAHETNVLYHISVEALIRMICISDERWRVYKRLVKHVEKCIKSYWQHFHSGKEVRANYLTFDKYLKEQLKRVPFKRTEGLIDTTSLDNLY